MLLDYKEAAAQLHDDISALGQQKKKKKYTIYHCFLYSSFFFIQLVLELWLPSDIH